VITGIADLSVDRPDATDAATCLGSRGNFVGLSVPWLRGASASFTAVACMSTYSWPDSFMIASRSHQ
jgi:hypothetical protein